MVHQYNAETMIKLRSIWQYNINILGSFNNRTCQFHSINNLCRIIENEIAKRVSDLDNLNE